MRKIIGIILILSVTLAFAAPRGLEIAYPSPQTLSIRIDPGEFHTYRWIENDREHVRYAFDHSNNILGEDGTLYEVMQFPIAYSGKIPDIRVRVTESADYGHSVEQSALFTVSEPRRFRDRTFVYLTVNPFLPDGRIARALLVEADLHRAAGKPVPDPLNRLFVNRAYADGLRKSPEARTPFFAKAADFTGSWLDVSVTEEGIYSLKRSDLQNAGIAAAIEDGKLYLYSGPAFGAPLRSSFPDSADLHLREVPMLFLDAASDADDQWVFYASGSSAWKRGVPTSDIRNVSYVRNPYESVQHFRLFAGTAGHAPKRMTPDTPVFTGSETDMAYTFQRLHFEEERINPGKGGELWFGERLSAASAFSFYLNGLYRDAPVTAALRLSFGLTTAGSHEFKTYLGDSLLYQYYTSIAKTSDDYDYESSISKRTQLAIPNDKLSEEFSLTVQYRGEFTTSEGFLDYIDIIYPRQPRAVDGRLDLWFRSFEDDRKIRVTGLTGSLSYVFGVEDPFNIRYFPVSGTQADLRVPADGTDHAFLVLNEGHFKTPAVSILPDFTPRNTADHAAQVDLIIITPDAFAGEANRLAAHKESRSIQPLNTLVKTYSGIIGQFNAGNRDPFAIWHFLSNMYAQAPDPKPLYVLLLGDGHYDYQNRIFS
ncbi:MAG: hypothetical protein JXR21_04225, partial [Candidatus Marinimicrobia bacterium]|nr:hypothetical protein [Candidatus Neomarinimicrobiota bacterium]